MTRTGASIGFAWPKPRLGVPGSKSLAPERPGAPIPWPKGAIGVAVGVGVMVLVLVDVRVGVMVLVFVGVRVGVMVLVWVATGVTPVMPQAGKGMAQP